GNARIVTAVIRDVGKAASHQAEERISGKMFAFFGCNKAHGNPKMSTSHRQIVSVRGVLSHACLRKANWDIGMVTGFCHSPGIAVFPVTSLRPWEILHPSQ